MPRQKCSPPQLPLLYEGVVSAWQVELDARPSNDLIQKRHSGLTLNIEGKFLDPLKGQESFHFTLYGMRESFDLNGALGSISKINPRVLGAMFLGCDDLQHIFTMACAGQLKSLMLQVDPPYRGSARIHSCYFFGGTMSPG